MEFPIADENVKMIRELSKQKEPFEEQLLSAYLSCYMNPDLTAENYLKEFVQACYTGIEESDQILTESKERLRQPESEEVFEDHLSYYIAFHHLQYQICEILRLLHEQYDSNELYDISKAYHDLEGTFKLDDQLPTGAYLTFSRLVEKSEETNKYLFAHVRMDQPALFGEVLVSVIISMFLSDEQMEGLTEDEITPLVHEVSHEININMLSSEDVAEAEIEFEETKEKLFIPFSAFLEAKREEETL